MEYLPGGGQMKEADQYTIQTLGIPSLELMERAAGECVCFMEEKGLDLSSVCVVCGSGNNGGDGFAVARLLLGKGEKVTAVMIGNRSSATKETAFQMEQFEKAGGVISDEYKADEYSIIVDGIFGVGLSRKIEGRYAGVIEKMNQSSGVKVAIDIPSGVSADTGRVLGCAFRADYTVTFQARKIGLLLYPGKEYAGNVEKREIGISELPLEQNPHTAIALSEKDYASLLPERPGDSHKGTYGKLLVIAGSKGMSGAAYLNAYAAYTAGAGLVQIYTPEENRPILQQLLPEAIIRPYEVCREEELKELLGWATVVLAGSGLGKGENARKIMEILLREGRVPTVVDADGLNLIAERPELMKKRKHKDYIFTPHMKEMERLCGKPAAEIKANRLLELEKYVEKEDLTCVLKDSRTAVQSGKGRACLNLTGSSAMAKAGAGDVLAGIIAGLLAQGMTCENAARLGVYLHGRAGEKAGEELGIYSVLARDLIRQLGPALKEIEKIKKINQIK
ncbi:NAD(P)H-hydrate dehydratase [Lachnospiraceae bacterium KGMB03038]|nr:NAD(P)H-hydrate dehydratase [Lachnospiraceae bacterium KGMB03038]